MLNTQCLPWTHIIYCQDTVDIRDGYAGVGQVWHPENGDIIVVPSGGSAVYRVILVEFRNRGLPTQHKRCYCDRIFIDWTQRSNQ